MNTELLGIILMYGIVLGLALLLGRYIGKVFNYESTFLDIIFDPIDNLFYKIARIDPTREMSWKENLTALLTINVFWFVIAFFVLTNMAWLPLNPDANPLENPSYFTNIVETVSIFLIPIALIFAMGYMLKRKKLAWTIYGVMTIGFLLLVTTAVTSEMNGSPVIDKMGIAQNMGSMEGKEIRFGAAASAYWAVNTTVISNGSVNAMHDSLTPLGGMAALLGMMINCFYGGVGVGFLNFYIFIILAVFISGLMVGRTPEFLGKKIEAKEMKIAMVIALLHPLFILGGTALASYLFNSNPMEYAGWLNNPSYHGFSEMLYEFTSASANNGSGFEGLRDNTPFWNIACGIVMLLARFLPIIGPIAIAGILAKKKYIPESAGTLKTDTATFGLMILAVIFIIAALAFFPALTLGTLAEFFTV